MKKKVSSTEFKVNDNPNLWKKLFILVPILVLFLYSPLVRQEYINYDDDWAIYENPFITNFSAEKVEGLFESFYYGQYSPFAMTLIGSLYSISDGKPSVLKAGALLIHIVNVILMFLLIKEIFKDNRLAFLISALFAFHPVQIETIAWLSAAYKIGLYSLFTLSGLFLWTKYQKEKKPIFYIMSIIMMIFSCLSKEQAVIFPLYIILLIYLQDRRVVTKENLIKLVPFAIISIVFLIITFLAIESYSEVQAHTYSLPQRIYFLSFTFVSYLKLFLFPFKLSAAYLSPDVTTGNTGYFIFPFLSILALLIMYIGIRNNRQVFTGILLFFISVLLTLGIQIINVRDILYADRYLYLGIPGLALALIAGLEHTFKKNLIFLWGIIILLLVGLSIQRIKVFQNSETLWTDAIKKNPKNALAFNNRGHYFRRNNQAEKALADYNKALEANPKFYLSLNNRGKIFFDSGKTDLALDDFNKALAIAPDFPSALSNRGAAYGMKQDWDNSLADLNRALELKPESTDALSNRGLVFFQTGEYQKCIEDYSKYLEIKPNDPDIINSIIVCYIRMKDYDKALVESNKSINMNPDKGTFYMNRSYIYYYIGDNQKALHDALKAKDLGFSVDQNYLKTIQ